MNAGTYLARCVRAALPTAPPVAMLNGFSTTWRPSRPVPGIVKVNPVLIPMSSRALPADRIDRLLLTRAAAAVNSAALAGVAARPDAFVSALTTSSTLPRAFNPRGTAPQPPVRYTTGSVTMSKPRPNAISVLLPGSMPNFSEMPVSRSTSDMSMWSLVCCHQSATDAPPLPPVKNPSNGFFPLARLLHASMFSLTRERNAAPLKSITSISFPNAPLNPPSFRSGFANRVIGVPPIVGVVRVVCLIGSDWTNDPGVTRPNDPGVTLPNDPAVGEPPWMASRMRLRSISATATPRKQLAGRCRP